MNGEEPHVFPSVLLLYPKRWRKTQSHHAHPRKPGEQIEVDWAGDPAQLIDDPDTGDHGRHGSCRSPYLASMPLKAYLIRRQTTGLKRMSRCLNSGGITPMLIPDNCSTAVNHSKSDWYTTALNATYHEMAEHYNVAIIPARVRKPKDKPNVKVPLVRSPHGSLESMNSPSPFQN